MSVLTDEQQHAIMTAVDRYKQGLKYVTISGWAGCGKTYIVKYIIEALNLSDSQVIFTAYTGKACEVLKRKGNKNVSTLHKLLYDTVALSDGSFVRRVTKSIPYKCVVVDECSMMPSEMREIFEEMPNIFIIYLGDEGQLPPIREEDNNHLLDNPHARLTKIMRQEEGSDILDVATAIRLGQEVGYYEGKDVKILPKSALNSGMLLWADIIICATNRQREFINKEIRKIKGYEKVLEEGEKVICLKNEWEILSNEDSPLINGTIGYVSNICKRTYRYPTFVFPERDVPIHTFSLTTEVDEKYNLIAADTKIFIDNQPTLPPQSIYKINRNKRKIKTPTPQQFTYGYAITCWKAQGSQWDKVLIIEEEFPKETELRKKFMYTAITRAASKLVILK